MPRVKNYVHVHVYGQSWCVYTNARCSTSTQYSYTGTVVCLCGVCAHVLTAVFIFYFIKAARGHIYTSYVYTSKYRTWHLSDKTCTTRKQVPDKKNLIAAAVVSCKISCDIYDSYKLRKKNPAVLMFVRLSCLRVRYNTTPIAEGGFSFVYRARKASTGEHYALKKILCQVCSHICTGMFFASFFVSFFCLFLFCFCIFPVIFVFLCTPVYRPAVRARQQETPAYRQ